MYHRKHGYTGDDQALVSADRLNFYLSGHGYQVYMENETSLLGQNLTDALPLRIGDYEVFIPILTKISNDSTWMRREFDWAQSTILPAMIDRVADAQKIVENAQAQNPGDWDLARVGRWAPTRPVGPIDSNGLRLRRKRANLV
ncbi:toll/interleukin-1 receptor domain-containing protein [Nitrosomonas sp.]|uniref:toll/interleukin-1 receptor domain-containing protein n=1 Tax=Nitrosomonas sp. TaxID=42353 RepID=UPI00261D3B67|nr:toll/interleukin-1 receptor domain-containing protein [Nitrosomonas sp.]